MPGQGGMVIATNASGRAGVGAKLKRGSERDGQRRPRPERINRFDALLTAPDAAPAR